MNFQVFMSPFLLLLLIFFLTANIQSSLGDLEDYLACFKPFKCGDFTVGYPFWGCNRPAFCGRPELELKCEIRHTPMINISGVNYIIHDIDEKSQTLRIARADYEDGLCHPQFTDTTMHRPRLDYYDLSEIEMITFFYDCHPPSGSNASLESMMMADYRLLGCHGKDDFAMKKIDHSPFPSGACRHKVTTPINKEFILPWFSDSDIEGGLKEGFKVKWNISKKCETCIHSGGSCVIDLETTTVQCYCLNKPALLSACPAPSAGHWKLRTLKMSIPLGVTAGIIILVCILLIFQRQKLKLHKVLYSSEKQKQLQNGQTIEDFLRSYGCHGPQIYSYYDIKMMTDFFSTKLGQGGFGDVYKGELRDGRHVAVKLLKESKENGEEFINEVASISRTSHVNVVTLLGFCFEKKKQALVYEFMPNGSLDKYIYGQESSITTNQLGWNTLYRIGVGIARGLEYLHSGCNTRIVHFDIKPHNILLDEDFCPKISDFGLSKTCKRKESIISMLDGRGTPGYIAPEVFNRNFGEVSHKSDVYSYGMMIIEMVGGRKNMDARVSQESEIYFHDWIYKYTEPGNELHGVITEEEQELSKKMILVSLWCIQPIPSDRPSVSKVVEMLEGRVEDLQVPPKPSLCSPVKSIKWPSQTSSTVS